MRSTLACLAVCCLLGVAGCGDAALKERIATLEKENQQLKTELDKARKAEADSRDTSQRERKAREQAANNLKQINLAVHKYQDQQVTIPNLGKWKPEGWAAWLLPYLEQQGTEKKPDPKK